VCVGEYMSTDASRQKASTPPKPCEGAYTTDAHTGLPVDRVSHRAQICLTIAPGFDREVDVYVPTHTQHETWATCSIVCSAKHGTDRRTPQGTSSNGQLSAAHPACDYPAAVPVLPGAWSGTPAAHAGQVSGPGS
jgi:hypothetical protein